MTVGGWIFATIETCGPWVFALIGLAIVVFANWPTIRSQFALSPRDIAAKEFSDKEKKQEVWFAQQAYQDKVKQRNSLQQGMIWLVGEAHSDRDTYNPVEGNEWVTQAIGFTNRLHPSHRTRFGCSYGPSYDEFRRAVAEFRAIADNLRPEDISD